MPWRDQARATAALLLLLVAGAAAGQPGAPPLAMEAPHVRRVDGKLTGDFQYTLVVGTFYEWNTDPTAVPGLMSEVTARTGVRATVNFTPISLDEDRICRNPLLIMTGNRFFHLTDAETATLRRYLNAGGFIYADDCGGADLSFRMTITNLLPGATLVELDKTNPVFHSFYDLDGPPKILNLYNGPARAFGAYVNHRLAVLYTYDTDIPCGWEKNPDGSFVHLLDEAKHDAAYRMGVNIVLYALGQRHGGASAAPPPTPAAATARPPAAGGTLLRGPVRTYRMERRMPYNLILAIAPAGHTVWFGGRRMLPGEQEGLARYDEDAGAWQLFTDSEGVLADEVNCLAADDAGLWIGTSTVRWRWNQGLWYYDFTTRRSTRHTVEEGLADNDVYGIAPDGDTVWLATRSGLARWNRKTRTWSGDPSHNRDYLDGSFCVAADARYVWCGRATGLRRYDKQRRVYDQFDAANSPIGGMVNALVEDGPTLWISCPPQLFAFRDGRFSEPAETRALAADEVLCGAADTNLLCFGTRNGGLYARDDTAGAWRCWNETNGLPSRCIAAAAVTARSLWCAFGTGQLGVGRFDRQSRAWSFTGYRAGIPCDHLYAVHADGRTLYLGTMGNGFWKYDIGRDRWTDLETLYRADNALSVRADVYAILQEGPAVWFGTNLGLCRHEAGTDTYQAIDGTTAAVDALAGCAGAILCGTKQAGLLAYDPRRKSWSDMGRRCGLPAGAVTALAADGSRVWVGREKGLSRIDAQTRTRLDVPQELAATPVTTLLVRDGVAWVGTPDGLFSLPAGQSHAVRYGRDAGLPDASITSLMAASDGVLIGTRKGLALLPTGAAKAVVEKQLRDCLVSALCQDTNFLWVATLGNGLVRFGKTAAVIHTDLPPLPGGERAGVRVESNGPGTHAPSPAPR